MNNSKNKELDINVYPTREEMGQAAGREVENRILDLAKEQDLIRMVFAAAPSQTEMLGYLAGSASIPWNKIAAFNMDEYIGLPADASQSFSSFLRKNLFDRLDCRSVELINTSGSIDNEKERYAALLSQGPIDIVCLGIGENGHIAFNDPPVADFDDPVMIKEVELDESCKIQQVNDGCFPSVEDVPARALTLTIPTLMSANYIVCVAPGAHKRQAVFSTLNYPVNESCPATILQTHPNCSFYFDKESYGPQ